MEAAKMGRQSGGYLLPLILIFGFVVWFVLPLPLGIIHGLVQNRWMLQDTSRAWAYIGVVAAVLFLAIAIPLVIFQRSLFQWSVLLGLAGWSLLSGWYGGPIALNLRNHSSTAHGQEVRFKIVHLLKGLVEIQTVEEDNDKITFKCSTSLWTSHYHPETRTAPGLVYRGRLGLLWGEFKDK
jgi:hypothetical protein